MRCSLDLTAKLSGAAHTRRTAAIAAFRGLSRVRARVEGTTLATSGSARLFNNAALETS